MANTISGTIRAWELGRKQRREGPFTPYFRGIRMLREGEKKRKQEAETRDVYKNIMSREGLGELPENVGLVAIPEYINEMRRRQTQRNEWLSIGYEPNENLSYPEQVKEYYGQKTTLEQKGWEEETIFKAGVMERLKKPTIVSEVSTKPFTKSDVPEKPIWDTYFSTKLTTAQKNKLDLIYGQGYTIYPDEISKTINFYDREIAEGETKKKEEEEISTERKDVETGLARYRVTMGKKGEVAKMYVMIGGSWKKIKNIKKAQTEEWDSDLVDVYKYLEEYLSLKEREKKLESISPLDVETGLGSKYIIKGLDLSGEMPEGKPRKSLDDIFK